MTETSYRGQWHWRDDAACARSSYDFTIEPTETITVEEVNETRAACALICAGCPVRNHCQADANPRRDFGVWAGKFYDAGNGRPAEPGEPQAVSKTGRRLPSITHGTPYGAKQHRQRGDRPCGDCKAAERAYDRQRNHKGAA